MSSSTPSPHPTNELAKERTRAASERTLSTWINNCLVLFGFGITLDQIYPGLERLLSRRPDQTVGEMARITGLSFVGISIALLLTVMVQHFLILQWLEQPESQFKTTSFLRLNQVSIAAVIIFGVLSLMIILTTFS
jgi:putative membrane protein